MQTSPVSRNLAPFWRRPSGWVITWLVYSIAMLGYLAYESARRGVVLCTPLS